METIKKITPQEFMQRLRERAEKAKAEGKVLKTMPMKHTELIAKLRERAALKINNSETKKKEE